MYQLDTSMAPILEFGLLCVGFEEIQNLKLRKVPHAEALENPSNHIGSSTIFLFLLVGLNFFQHRFYNLLGVGHELN